MSEIVITGATGVVGWRAVYELQRAGHGVAGVTRSARGRRVLESLGARAVQADVFDEASLTAAFAGADAVVNLLTHIPTADRMAMHSAWDENDRLRRVARRRRTGGQGRHPARARAVSRSQRASNRRLHDATGWAPRVRAGIDGWRLITETPLAA